MADTWGDVAAKKSWKKTSTNKRDEAIKGKSPEEIRALDKLKRSQGGYNSSTSKDEPVVVTKKTGQQVIRVRNGDVIQEMNKEGEVIRERNLSTGRTDNTSRGLTPEEINRYNEFRESTKGMSAGEVLKYHNIYTYQDKETGLSGAQLKENKEGVKARLQQEVDNYYFNKSSETQMSSRFPETKDLSQYQPGLNVQSMSEDRLKEKIRETTPTKTQRFFSRVWQGVSEPIAGLGYQMDAARDIITEEIKTGSKALTYPIQRYIQKEKIDTNTLPKTISTELEQKFIKQKNIFYEASSKPESTSFAIVGGGAILASTGVGAVLVGGAATGSILGQGIKDVRRTGGVSPETYADAALLGGAFIVGAGIKGAPKTIRTTKTKVQGFFRELEAEALSSRLQGKLSTEVKSTSIGRAQKLGRDVKVQDLDVYISGRQSPTIETRNVVIRKSNPRTIKASELTNPNLIEMQIKGKYNQLFSEKTPIRTKGIQQTELLSYDKPYINILGKGQPKETIVEFSQNVEGKGFIKASDINTLVSKGSTFKTIQGNRGLGNTNPRALPGQTPKQTSFEGKVQFFEVEPKSYKDIFSIFREQPLRLGGQKKVGFVDKPMLYEPDPLANTIVMFRRVSKPYKLFQISEVTKKPQTIFTEVQTKGSQGTVQILQTKKVYAPLQQETVTKTQVSQQEPRVQAINNYYESLLKNRDLSSKYKSRFMDVEPQISRTRFSYKTDSGIKSKASYLQGQNSKLRTSIINIQRQEPSSKVSSLLDQKQATRQSIKPQQALALSTVLSSRLASKQAQEYKLRQDVKQAELLQTVNLLRNKQINKTPLRTITNKRKDYDSPLGLKKALLQKTSRDNTPGFDLLIKRKGKYELVGQDFSRKAGLDFLASKLKRTLQATGELVPTGQTAKITKTTGTYDKFSNEFRNYKVKKGKKIPLRNTIIQKRGYRLGTSFETSLIQKAKKGGVFL